jgi:hypothetical protein
VNQIRKRISLSVHGLMGSLKEDEVVADAFHACHVNMELRGYAFCFLGTGARKVDGVLRDDRAYRRLLKEGFFIQVKCLVKKVKKLPRSVCVDADGYVPMAYLSRTLAAKMVQQLKNQGKEAS